MPWNRQNGLFRFISRIHLNSGFNPENVWILSQSLILTVYGLGMYFCGVGTLPAQVLNHVLCQELLVVVMRPAPDLARRGVVEASRPAVGDCLPNRVYFILKARFSTELDLKLSYINFEIGIMLVNLFKNCPRGKAHRWDVVSSFSGHFVQDFRWCFEKFLNLS